MKNKSTLYKCGTKTTLVLALILAVTTVYSASGAGDGDRPNILWLVADDLGYADVGVQGCTDVPTPNLDSIAKNGVRFTSGYVSAPVCSPSRAGLITGRYQTRFGHEFNHPQADQAPGVGLPVSQKTVAEQLKKAGYVTGHIGKWHLGNPKSAEYSPQARGFVKDVWFPGQNKLPPLTLYRNGEVEHADDKYVDEAMAREGAAFVEQHKKESWFLYVAFLTPHQPLDTPPGSETPFAAITNNERRKCAAMITLLDDSVGKILKALRETGQLERTLIVFHSDNGAPPKNGSRNTPLRGDKASVWEGGIREPFLMQFPGVLPAGRVVDQPIISLDVLPTALALAGVKVNPDIPLDGVNLLPFLTGKTTNAPHENLFWRYGDQRAVRSGDWKLVTAIDRSVRPPTLLTGLYDLAKDVSEKNDLSATHPDKVQELQQLWDKWNQQNVKALWGGGSGQSE
jgi:arylsulfatase A-like enzyme